MKSITGVMKRLLPVTLFIALLMLAAVTLAGGCSRAAEQPESPDTEAPAQDAPVPDDGTPGSSEGSGDGASEQKQPTEEPTADGRPSIAEAEAAVLRISREMYQDIVIEDPRIVGMGRDAAGLWWVQGWTSAGPEYESEQWFITFDGTTWEYVDSGTGMERSDYPDDIVWEDVR